MNDSEQKHRSDLNRRSVIGLATGLAAGAATVSPPQKVSPAIQPSDIVLMDAVGLASAIHSRQVFCVEVMTAYLDHIERLNPKVNAIVALQERSALLAQAAQRDAQLASGAP